MPLVNSYTVFDGQNSTKYLVNASIISCAFNLIYDSPLSIKLIKLCRKLGWVIRLVNTVMCDSFINDSDSIKNYSFSMFKSCMSYWLLNSSYFNLLLDLELLDLYTPS